MPSKLFSERMGYEPPRPALQVEDIDAPLRNRLLNCLDGFVSLEQRRQTPPYRVHSATMRSLWDAFLKRPLRALDELHVDKAQLVVTEVFREGPWYQVYSLLEFISSTLQDHHRPQFEGKFNAVLTEELAGYRFVNGHITPITNQTEIESLEEGLEASHPPAREHLGKALALFAERERPNYAKVIQESVSAVEAQLQELTGKSKVADAVAELNKLGRGSHHQSLLEGFKKIYGWTSEAGGIRHAAKGDPPPTQALAKYTLVTCSAFVNYLEELRATR